MAFYSCNRYRTIVLVLLILIMWQFFRLLPQKPALDFAESITQHQPIRVLERTSTVNVYSFPNIPTNGPRNWEYRIAQTTVILELEDDKYNKHKQDKVKIRVYYEALCPDSKHFFIKHLTPVTDKLSDFIDVTLVPYGKATTKEVNGQYTFRCQHGEEECYANRIHACSIDAIGNMTTSVIFTNCMIADNMDPDAALSRCAKQMKIDPDPISNCATHEHGMSLLKKYGDDTHLLKPTFIPTITLNSSKDNQAAILKNFLLEVCKLIDMPLPPPCL